MTFDIDENRNPSVRHVNLRRCAKVPKPLRMRNRSRSRCIPGKGPMVVPMGAEMFHRYQEGLSHQKLTVLHAFRDRVRALEAPAVDPRRTGV